MKVYQITTDMDPKVVQSVLDENIEYNYVPCKSEEDIIDNCRDADALVSIYEPVTRKVIDSLENLKYLCIGSIGYDNVDVNYAKEKEIAVSNNPSYCIEEVAQHVLAMILNFNRKILGFNRSIKKDREWDFTRYANDIHRLISVTIGLIGFGKISRQLNDYLQILGCRVISYDPFVSDDLMKLTNVEKVSLEKIQEQSDYISLHLPLNEDTKEIIDLDFLSNCKKKPVLINCSRGALVVEADLKKALENQYISGLGLDVLSNEDPDLNDYDFLDCDQLIITPHAAFYSLESVKEADETVGHNLNNFYHQIKGDTNWL